MQALGDAGITVPTIVPAASGDMFVTHAGDGLPGEIQVDLLSVSAAFIVTVVLSLTDRSDRATTNRAGYDAQVVRSALGG